MKTCVRNEVHGHEFLANGITPVLLDRTASVTSDLQVVQGQIKLIFRLVRAGYRATIGAQARQRL